MNICMMNVEKELEEILRGLGGAENNRDRKLIIQKYLKSSGIKYVRQLIPETTGDNYNICVPFGLQKNKIVIGAHMDVVEGSSGMNDNLASVSIIIRLLREIVNQNMELPLEIVFFDEEEHGRKGSKYYALKEKSAIRLMINLDVCGFGNRIVYSYKGNLSLAKAILDKAKENIEIVELDDLPESDNVSFEEQGISSISIALLPSYDIKILKSQNNLKEIFSNSRKRKKIFQELTVVKTTHGGEFDNIDIIEYRNMCKIFKFLSMLLYRLIKTD